MVNEFQKGGLEFQCFMGLMLFMATTLFTKQLFFPLHIGLGATRDPELVKRIGAATALEVRSNRNSICLCALYSEKRLWLVLSTMRVMVEQSMVLMRTTVIDRDALMRIQMSGSFSSISKGVATILQFEWSKNAC